MSYNPFENDILRASQKIKPKLSKKTWDFLQATIAIRHVNAIEELDHLTYQGRDETNEFPARYLIAYVVMIFMNIADDQCEIPNTQVTSHNLLTHPIIDGHSFEDLQAFLNESENIKAVEPIKGSRIREMHNAQQRGIQMVTNTLIRGQVSYSFQEALDYRLATLGNYFYLLAELGLKGSKTQKKYAQNLMIGQARDDMRDVVEDLHSQVNPFLAVLAKYKLISLLSEHLNFEDILTSARIPLDIAQHLSEDEWKIKTAYSQI